MFAGRTKKKIHYWNNACRYIARCQVFHWGKVPLRFCHQLHLPRASDYSGTCSVYPGWAPWAVHCPKTSRPSCLHWCGRWINDWSGVDYENKSMKRLLHVNRSKYPFVYTSRTYLPDVKSVNSEDVDSPRLEIVPQIIDGNNQHHFTGVTFLTVKLHEDPGVWAGTVDVTRLHGDMVTNVWKQKVWHKQYLSIVLIKGWIQGMINCSWKTDCNCWLDWLNTHIYIHTRNFRY